MTVAYRPDIDGLRAIAVLGVLIYHADLWLGDSRLVSAGFLGVDIFFVISGFLITRILVTEVSQGTFSFANFYERRARRILPVLFLVIACTLPFAWWLMLPPAMVDYAGSVFTSILYSSNFWFWSSDSYWGQASALKPLLHTWSLSLEEQFYLIAPWVVVLFFRRLKVFVGVLFVLLLASFITAEIWSHSKVESGFYLLPARAWELLVGSLVAVFMVNKPVEFSRSIREAVSVLGLSMIVLSMIMFDSELRHPSAYTLLPVFGAAMLILVGESTLTARLLSLKPMIWIGLLSYSIYLWHFPIFAFFKIALIELSIIGKLICMLASVLLAVVSYWLVEKPFRNKRKIGTTKIVTGLVSSALVMLMASTWAYVTKGLPDRFHNFNDVLVYLDYPYKESFLSHSCFLHPEDLKAKTGFVNCQYNRLTDNTRPTLFLWGDSNAAHLIPGIRQHYADSHNLYLRTISGCGVFMTEKIARRPGCKDHNAESFQQIIDSQPEILLIAGLWKPEFVDRLSVTLNKLKQHNIKNVVVIGPVPRWTPSLPAAILKYRESNKNARLFPAYLQDPAQSEIRSIDNDMQEMVLETGYQYYSPYQKMCNTDRGCSTNIDGKLTQWDYGHLTDEGSLQLIDGLTQALSE